MADHDSRTNDSIHPLESIRAEAETVGDYLRELGRVLRASRSIIRQLRPIENMTRSVVILYGDYERLLTMLISALDFCESMHFGMHDRVRASIPGAPRLAWTPHEID